MQVLHTADDTKIQEQNAHSTNTHNRLSEFKWMYRLLHCIPISMYLYIDISRERWINCNIQHSAFGSKIRHCKLDVARACHAAATTLLAPAAHSIKVHKHEIGQHCSSMMTD